MYLAQGFREVVMVLADQPDTVLPALRPDSHQFRQYRVGQVFGLPAMDRRHGFSRQPQRFQGGRVHRQDIGQAVGIGLYPLAGAGGKAG